VIRRKHERLRDASARAHARVRNFAQVPALAGIVSDKKFFDATGLINARAQRYYPLPVCTPDVRTGRSRTFEYPRGHPFVNAVSLLRAEAAHEPALQPALREHVARAVRRYLADVESQPREGLHALVLHEVESPLLGEVLAWYGGNQSKAAAALGINRATLRKKLHQYGLTD
jgi:Fis family transcriptional regulator